jgi:hypothetical protein
MAGVFNDDVVNANFDNVFYFKPFLNVTKEDNVLFLEDYPMQLFIKKMEIINTILLILDLTDNIQALNIDTNDLMGMFKDSFTVNTLRVILFQMVDPKFSNAFLVLYGFYLQSDTKTNLSDIDRQFFSRSKKQALDAIRSEVLTSIGKEKDNNPSKLQAPVLDINASKIKAVELFLNSDKTKGMLEGFRRTEYERSRLSEGLISRAGKAAIKGGGGISKKVRTVKRKAKKVRNVTRKINKFNKLTNSNKKKINKSKKTN